MDIPELEADSKRIQESQKIDSGSSWDACYDPEKGNDVQLNTETRQRSRDETKVTPIILPEEAQKNKTKIHQEALPLTDLDTGIVGWESEDDPAMPFNFSSRQKWSLVSLLSAITLLTPLATSILSPAITILDADFGNANPTLGSMTVSIYLFGYVVGPIFIGPLSEVYGRKPVLATANVFFCLWQIGCALAPDIETLVVARFFSGVGGAACLTLGGSIIGDLFRPERRGLAMGMWNLGPLLGPVVGPVIGGFMAQYISWRWDFWLVLCAAAPVTLLLATCTKESCHKVLIARKAARLRKELGRDDLVNCYDAPSAALRLHSLQILRTSLVRPFKLMFTSPIVFFLSMYIAFVFGVVYTLYTTLPSVFEEKYHFDIGKTGIPYVALGLGNALAWLLFTLYSDKIVIKLAKANGGVFTPEMRLALSIPFGVLLPVTLFWYGWSAYFTVHWASTFISLVPFGFGIVGLFLPISTYIVDSYPIYAASATAANVIIRSIVGALLPLAGPPLYSSMGLGWGNSLLGFICIMMVPLPFVFYKFGAQLREAQRTDL